MVQIENYFVARTQREVNDELQKPPPDRKVVIGETYVPSFRDRDLEILDASANQLLPTIDSDYLPLTAELQDVSCLPVWRRAFDFIADWRGENH